MSWPVVEIQEICRTGSGTTPSRKNADYYSGQIPWVKSGELRETEIFGTEEHVTEKALSETSLKLVPPGALLVAMYGATVGRVGLLGVEATTNQAVCHVVPDNERAYTRYLFHLLQAKAAELVSRGVGGAQPNISQGIIKSLKIPLPPLEEQKRIAGILDQAAELCRLRTRALDKLNTLGQAIFHEMFGDPVDPSSEYVQKPLKEYVDDERPITYGILKPGPDTPDGIPYIRVVDMVVDEIDPIGVRRTTNEIASEYKRSRLKGGDLLMSIRGHVGRTSIVPTELEGANITQDTARLAVPTKEAEYFRYSILHPGTQEWMRRRTKGAAVKGINLGDLRELPIPDAPHDQRIAFCQKLEAVRSKLAAHRKSCSHSQSLFASLQHRAFRGEL